MPRKHVDRVNAIKCVKVAGKWRFAALVEKDGEIVRDHVWIGGQDEHHPEGRYFLDWHDRGKRHRQRVTTFDELAEATRRKYRELSGANSNLSVSVPDGSTKIAPEQIVGTLSGAIERYLEFIAIHRSLGTLRSYRLTLKLLYRSYRKIHIHEVRRDDILEFMMQCYRQGFCGRTVYNKLVIVLQFFRHYGHARLVERSDWPAYVEAVRPIYQREEVELLLRHAEEDERVLLKFLLASGFRDREVRCVAWRDIDFHSCIARVTVKTAWHFTPKNWEERVVPLPLALIQQLGDLKKRRHAHSNSLIFPNSKGNPNASHIMIVKLVAERAGLNCRQCRTKHGNSCADGPHCRHFYLHKFRHTFATEHLRHGVDIRTVQQWMGHRDIQSTMVYLRGLESKDAHAKINAGSLAAYVALPHTKSSPLEATYSLIQTEFL
jgi:integrase/recombinase XerD